MMVASVSGLYALSHDCAPGSPSPVEHVDGVKAIAELLRVALDEFRLFAAEVAASVSCLGVHEVDERVSVHTRNSP